MAASVRNTAIKRIQGDVREMITNPSDQYAAAPLEVSNYQHYPVRSDFFAQTNMFDWHFTLRGPRDTEFEGGIYHGRIILPSDYPFKPPNIMLLTPNGRFEVKKKICLSISAYHPEEWQPAWGVRLILEALISFMPTKGEGAIGALDFPAEERKRLAKLVRAGVFIVESVADCCGCFQSVDYKCETCGRVADLLPELEEESE
ncbi:Ubiquitin-conjugating enzyme E2, partial [Phytophthora megakarya]